jgi:hypothetical protein
MSHCSIGPEVKWYCKEWMFNTWQYFLMFAPFCVNTTNNINFTTSTVNTTNVCWFKPYYMFRPLMGHPHLHLKMTHQGSKHVVWFKLIKICCVDGWSSKINVISNVLNLRKLQGTHQPTQLLCQNWQRSKSVTTIVLVQGFTLLNLRFSQQFVQRTQSSELWCRMAR